MDRRENKGHRSSVEPREESSKIKAQRYLAEQRENFGDEPWQYVPTAKVLGCEWSDFTNKELEWQLAELQRERKLMEEWKGSVKYTPEEKADMDRRIAEVSQAIATS